MHPGSGRVTDFRITIMNAQCRRDFACSGSIVGLRATYSGCQAGHFETIVKKIRLAAAEPVRCRRGYASFQCLV